MYFSLLLLLCLFHYFLCIFSSLTVSRVWGSSATVELYWFPMFEGECVDGFFFEVEKKKKENYAVRC